MRISSAYLAIPAILMAGASTEARATDCSSQILDAFDDAADAYSEYGSHGGLGTFHFALRLLNDGFAQLPKIPVCHFVNDLGMGPKKSKLPFDSTKSLIMWSGVRDVRLHVTVPTEPFAATYGYDAKAEVNIDGHAFMVMYWGGSGEKSRGFIAQLGDGFDPAHTSPLYLQWDRSTDQQFVKVAAARHSAAGWMSANGDAALRGRAEYDKKTGLVSAQATALLRWHGENRCVRTVGHGTLGQTLTVGYPDFMSLSGGRIFFVQSDGASGWNGTDSSGMAVEQLVDSRATNSGTPSSFVVSSDVSCADLFAADQPGAIFANGDSSLSLGPDDVF